MKTLELNDEQIKMLKDACLCVIALMGKRHDADVVRYKTLYDYLNS